MPANVEGRMKRNSGNRFWLLIPAGIGIVAAVAAIFPSAAQQSSASIHRSTLDQYCVACHNDALLTANLSLQGLDIANLNDNGEIWEKVLGKLRHRQMPPAGMPAPPAESYEDMVTYLTSGLDQVAQDNPNPGQPALHRLNRAEYENAISDLLALEVDSTELLPADDIGYGFDNIGDVLTVSPLLLERYLSAADVISRLAIGDSSMAVAVKHYDVPSALVQDEWMNEELPFGSRGGVALDHHFPMDGEYIIKVDLQRARNESILGLETERQLDLRLDDQRLELFTISGGGDAGRLGATVAADSHLQVRMPVKAGTRRIVATFTKDTGKQEGIRVRRNGRIELRQQAFFDGVGNVSISGPFEVHGPGDTLSRAKIFTCYPTSQAEELPCAEEILSTLARSAYRRPVDAEDVESLLALYRNPINNGDFETGIMLALQKILVSPEFIFRVEYDSPDAEPGSVHPLSDLELASRLSFFLWSSIPDEELLSVAERGELRNPEMLDRQVQRMLADPRSETLVSNFVGQWLFLRNIPRVLPDPYAFPDFDENLREALQRETELLALSMLREDRSVSELLDSDYTFLNERLAQHYGIEGIYGPEFRRVAVTDEKRRGILGHASILTVTSYPNRTAPTIRGKWVMEQLLGTTAPPPPPDVPALAEDADTRAMTMRERMELHRTNAVCASCHQIMDPLGFALENFDGLGRWRDVNGVEGTAIDASGTLPDGTPFDGPGGLREVLMSKQELFLETFTERLLTYGLGRGVEYYDLPAIRKITNDAAENNYRWSSIISGIVHSMPFQMRKVSKG
jgi:mono/diheme cytochrome c family protein